MDILIDSQGDYSDDSAFYDEARWIKESRPRVEQKLPSKSLHGTLKKLATGLQASTQQIVDLQHDLRSTRCQWIDENKQHQTASRKLRHASDELLSSPFHGAKLQSQQHLSGLHDTPRQPFADSQQIPHVTSPSKGSQTKIDPVTMHRRLRMMIETSTEALRSTPTWSTAATLFDESPPPQHLTSSGLYLMVDASTGRPLGNTLIHPDLLNAVQQNLLHQPAALQSPASHAALASPARSSCHTQTAGSATTSPSQLPELQPHRFSEPPLPVDPCDQETQSWLGGSSHFTDQLSETMQEHLEDATAVPHSDSAITALTHRADRHPSYQQDVEADCGPGLDQEPSCLMQDQVAIAAIPEPEVEATDAVSDLSRDGDYANSAPGVEVSACGIQELTDGQKVTASYDAACLEPMAIQLESRPRATDPFDVVRSENPSPVDKEQASGILEAGQAQPVVSEPSFDFVQPAVNGSQGKYRDTVADTIWHTLDGIGMGAAGASDTHSDGTTTSLLQKSMKESMLHVTATAKAPYSNASDRHSSHSRRSSIVPADEMLPQMLTRPAQAGASRHSATSAVLGLLKEESDVFEDDAPLNFLQPAAIASSLPKGQTSTPAASTTRPDLGGFDFTRPSMDASLGSHEGNPQEASSVRPRTSPQAKDKSQKYGDTKPLFGESMHGGLDIDDFDF